MGRRSTVSKLPDEQFDFVIRAIVDYGWTDREISVAFKKQFGADLPKSSLNTWRNKAGNELAERYKLRRYQVRSFVQELQREGIDVSTDTYAHIIRSLEDSLLTNERDLVAQNPIRLLGLRQEDERLKIKRETLELKREQIALERQKLLGQQMDPVKNGTEFLTELFEFSKDDPEGVLYIKKIARPFTEWLQAKYGEAK